MHTQGDIAMWTWVCEDPVYFQILPLRDGTWLLHASDSLSLNQICVLGLGVFEAL